MSKHRSLLADLNEMKRKGFAPPPGARVTMRPGESAPQVMNRLASNTDMVAVDPTARAVQQNQSLVKEFQQRRGLTKSASYSDIQAAIPRFYDPLEYWDLSGLPWNMADEGHRHKLHKWTGLYYETHNLISLLIDMYTRFPLVGSHIVAKDRDVEEWYEDAFLDRLQYENFLVDLGREYWLGEAWAFGHFNETMGIFEREELLNGEDIVVEQAPLLGTKTFKLKPPQYLTNIVTTRTPPKEYKQLQINYPDLIPYLLRGEPFPISNVLLKQVAFKTRPWNDHGTSIILRILRTLMHQEKLLASQDAVAERLYSPLVLAKLGWPDTQTGQGWLPSPGQLDAFRDDLDFALSSDFRVLVHHYGLDIENVFGREQVPNLTEDFRYVDEIIMRAFGVNPSLLSGGMGAQPYASSALQAELMTQMMRTYQGHLKDHFRSRAAVVAEANQHYDYERRGQSRVPIMEEVVEVDEEGNIHIEEKHKLMDIELGFADFNLRDEATERQFLMELKQMGAPISDEHLMLGVEFDYQASLEEMQNEMIEKTVANAVGQLKAYKILQVRGLPIPPELRAAIEGEPAQGPGGPPGAEGGGMGGAPPMGGAGGAPGGMEGGMDAGVVMPPQPAGLAPGSDPDPSEMAGTIDGGPSARPAISDDRRQGMPQAVSHRYASLSMNEIDERIAGLQQDLHQARQEARARAMQRMSSVRTAAEREYDEPLPWDPTKKIVVDKVPPRYRRYLSSLESSQDDLDTPEPEPTGRLQA